MKPPPSIGVVGAGREAEALAGFAAPSARFRIGRWAPASGRADEARAASFAGRMGVPFAGDWSAIVADPTLSAVLVSADEAARHRIVAEALDAGKGVVCPGRMGRAAADACGVALHRGGGFLLAPGEIRYASGARSALEMIAAGDLGRLHSVYIAARTPAAGARHDARGILPTLGWDVVDFLAAAVTGPVTRIQGRGGRLFAGDGPGNGARVEAADDTAVALIRFASDVVATVELAQCLPPTLPPEVEIEVVGARRAIHLEPYRTAVRVHGGGDGAGRAQPGEIALHPWVDPPALAMIEEVLDIVDGVRPRPDGLAAVSRTIEVIDGLEAALAVRQDVV